MGGLRLPPTAETIMSAVSSSDPLPLHRLEHQLNKMPPSPDFSSLLTGLTHITSRLHGTSLTSQGVRRLVDAVLRLDVITLCATNDKGHTNVEAYSLFLVNLLSVDATYVEPFLQRTVPKIFLSSSQIGGIQAVNLACHVIAHVLRTHHRRAAPLLVDALRIRYPHPVRKLEEHVSYARALLLLTRGKDTPRPVVRALVAAVYERMAAIEALGDEDKLKAVLSELIHHVNHVFHIDSNLELNHSSTSPQTTATLSPAPSPTLAPAHVEIQVHVEALFAAHDALVVPVSTAKYAQYPLLYAAALTDMTTCNALTDRFRQAFHNGCVPNRLRTCYLEHSASFIVRLKCVHARDALTWLRRLAAWLNSYIDVIEHEQCLHESEDDDDEDDDNENHEQHQRHLKQQQKQQNYHAQFQNQIDVELHHVFFNACAILMATLIRRSDVLPAAPRAASELLARLRLHRILASPLSPLFVLPRALVDEFAQLVKRTAQTDIVGHIVRQNIHCHPIPSRTRSGAPNVLAYDFGCPDLQIASVRSEIDAHMRWDQELDMEKDENANGDNDDIEMMTEEEGEREQELERAGTDQTNHSNLCHEGGGSQDTPRKKVRFLDSVNVIPPPPRTTSTANVFSNLSAAQS